MKMNVGVARVVAVIATRACIIINGRSSRAGCAIAARPVPYPGVLRTDGNALVTAALAPIQPVFEAVEPSAIISLIAPAFAPVTHILNKVGASRRFEPPFARMGGGRRSASGNCYRCCRSSRRSKIKTHLFSPSFDAPASHARAFLHRQGINGQGAPNPSKNFATIFSTEFARGVRIRRLQSPGA